MEWWFVYGDLLYQQYQNERLRQAQKEALITIARGQSGIWAINLDLLSLVLAFLPFHIQ
jgi:hypothetical protein